MLQTCIIILSNGIHLIIGYKYIRVYKYIYQLEVSLEKLGKYQEDIEIVENFIKLDPYFLYAYDKKGLKIYCKFSLGDALIESGRK